MSRMLDEMAAPNCLVSVALMRAVIIVVPGQT